MVFVELKNKLFNSDDKKLLIPTSTAYETVDNRDDDEDSIEGRSIITSFDHPEHSESMSDGLVNPRVMSDIIIGLSDGLTVPFALTAGLSSLGDARLVITGGMAELVSGAISMGLGGYLAAKSEAEYYEHQVKKERLQYRASPMASTQELVDILSEYDLSGSTINSIISDMEKGTKNSSKNSMVDFIVRFGKGLEEPEYSRQFTSAFTIGSSYFLGGFVPLVPYFFTETVQSGLVVSVIVMAITLFMFGVVKTLVSLGTDCSRQKVLINGFQMLLTGGVAAGAAWALVRVIE